MRLWFELSANERLTQVNIAWLRRNGCSSEQLLFSIWETRHRCQEPNLLLDVNFDWVEEVSERNRLEVGLGQKLPSRGKARPSEVHPCNLVRGTR